MQREADAILKSAGYRLNWVSLGSTLRANYDGLVVLRFRGWCELEGVFRKPAIPGLWASPTSVTGSSFLSVKWNVTG